MAAESSEGEEEIKLSGGNQLLTVNDDIMEMGTNASWSVSSCKAGNGVSSLRDDNLETYWHFGSKSLSYLFDPRTRDYWLNRNDPVLVDFRSDGPQPHLVNIQIQKKVRLELIALYVDFKLDESYTPSKVSLRAGDGFHNLKEIKSVELVKPTGWVYLSLSGVDPCGLCFVWLLYNQKCHETSVVVVVPETEETFVNTFMLQIAVLSNHLNGRDTHVRQIKVYGPRPNPIPHQPFQFTSREFITYSSIR